MWEGNIPPLSLHMEAEIFVFVRMSLEAVKHEQIVYYDIIIFKSWEIKSQNYSTKTQMEPILKENHQTLPCSTGIMAR